MARLPAFFLRQHPSWKGEYPGGNDDHDFMLLVLTKPHVKQGDFVFSTTTNHEGLLLRLIGLGKKADGSYPCRPIMSPALKVLRSCNDERDKWAECTTLSVQSGCGGDSGGPWLLD